MSPHTHKAAMRDMNRPDTPSRNTGTANTVHGAVSGVSVQAESVTNAIIRQTVQIHHHDGRTRMRLDSPPWIVSRDDAAAAFGSAARSAHDGVVVANVSGPEGIGKTALAVSLLHDLHSREPDRFATDPLLVRFGEQTLDGAVTDLLCEIGARPGDIPLDRPDRHAMYRERTREFGPLGLLVDDAATPGVVETLLPAAPGSVVMVTSRNDLDDLDRQVVRDDDVGVAPLCRLRLGPLEYADAIRLYSLRSAREYAPDSAPRWLRDAAARVAGRPDAICRLAARHVDAPDAITTPPTGDARPQPENDTFGSDYGALPDTQRRLLRCLAWHPPTSFAVELVATLAGISVARAGELLRAWSGRQLVREVPDGGAPRHEFSGAARDWLRERSRVEDSQVGHWAAERICGHYLRWARAAHALLLPDRWLLDNTALYPDPGFADHDAALAWLERERRALNRAVRLAHDNGLHTMACQLCEVLWALYFKRSYYVDLVETHDLAVESARHLGRDGLATLSRMHVQRARPYLKQERFDDAHADAAAGLDAARRSGHTLATLTALEALGRVHFERGQLTEATSHYSEALELALHSGDPRAVVVERHQVARCQLAAGEPERALGTLRTVYNEVRQLPTRDPYNEARISTSLGETLTTLGDPSGARAHFDTALDLFSAGAADEQVAEVLALRAAVRDSGGDATRDLQDAYTLYTLLDSPRAPRIAERLRR